MTKKICENCGNEAHPLDFIMYKGLCSRCHLLIGLGLQRSDETGDKNE